MQGEHERATIDWAKFTALISSAQKVVLIGHVRPDGDTIGSNLAMKRALEALGKEALFVNGHAAPPGLRFLDGAAQTPTFNDLSEQARAFLDAADLVLTIDVSSWQQLGADASEYVRRKAQSGAVIATIDHHAVGDTLAPHAFVDANADSAGSLTFEAIQTLGVTITQEIATPLFVAIATDTGWFRFASTNADTLRRAASLIDAGVRVDAIYREVYEQESYGRFQLYGAAVRSAERILDGKGVIMSLRLADFDAFHAIASDSEDLVNEPLSIANMEVSAILIEQRDGTIKASFRSRCALDCAQLAREYGGGGHKQAAGATLHAPLTQALDQVKALLAQFYAQAQRD
ncbi:MAG: bifunctional oligoribonuclease/PAP phosphatase NrnA [Planctomycetia bacterium]|nr:bifunctional oligoribonuclease/PAP phosphatase NrnA [Planctomycetia bacterium]